MEYRIEGEAVAAAESAISEHIAPDEVTLSSGVVLKVRRVPPLLIRRATVHVRAPIVPVVLDPDRGREIENPNDPDYLQAVVDFEETANMAVLAVMIITGTRVVSTPDDLPPVSDDLWIEQLAAAGIDLELKTDPARYLAWIQYVAIAEIEDMHLIGAAVGRASGVREADVADAVSSFPSDLEPGADPELPVSASTTNGYSVPTAVGGISP